jgi:hypothetical protein
MAAKNMAELAKLLEKKIKSAMENEVKEVARNTLKENVITEVYDAYTPKMYERSGGLYQDENIESEMVNDTTLSVRSTREEDGKDIAEVIETGEGYTYRGYGYDYEKPRPFHAETARELDEKGLAKKALKQGLNRQGIKTK